MRPLMRSSKRGRRMGRRACCDTFGLEHCVFSARVRVWGGYNVKRSDCLLYKWVWDFLELA